MCELTPARNASGKILKTDCKKIVGEHWAKEQANAPMPRAKL